MKHEGAVTRTAGHRQEDIAAVSKAFRRAASIWINIRQWIGEETGTGKRKKRKKVLYTMSCNVIQIGRTIRQDELAPPPDINDPPRMPGVTVAYGYRIDPGILRLLTPPNRQVALLHQKSLRYDPYHQQWEKRLSRYFMFHLRIAAGHGSASIKRNPGALIGELSLPINRDEPQRTRERFEKAMNRLKKDGIFDDWQYAEGRPALPARKWLETWLTQWQVQVFVAPSRILPGKRYDAMNPDEERSGGNDNSAR
jgi:hypothetical protein